ncbi:MAG TPA: sialate O-acetylesterase, partial [Victivallales bacterium]|nr:sialate O-acetylesterase [Victivallales bacterium]
ADVSLPAIFSDHMVLQAETSVPVWGWAEPGEQVTVSIGDQSKAATADADGKWMIKLDKLKSDQATSLTVKGKNTITINDVLTGEVWFCSGQSNMAMKVKKSKDFELEKEAANYPKIRMFEESSNPNPSIQEKCNGSWKVCSPDTVDKFSATAYFFGRELFRKINQPIGLINSSVGGTPIEAWTSLEAQKDVPELKPLFETWEKRISEWDQEKANAAYEEKLAKYKEALAKEGKPEKKSDRPKKPESPVTSGSRPANLFNSKIAPLIPYSIKGAIWYQGEANAKNLEVIYDLTLPLMIKDWRTRWNQGDFPFAWVQLPGYKKVQEKPVEEGPWPNIRECMLKALSVPNTGMAITIDVGEAEDIHPKNKQEVGKRLAMWALAKVYGQNCAFSGPLPAGHEIKGSEIVCSFKHTDGGLVSKDGELKGFAIAGADKIWYKANARIDGDKVVVSSPEVKEPKAVRYAWANNPVCNLFNGAGIPASPFRTDDWK